jgi:hypothetical protein
MFQANAPLFRPASVLLRGLLPVSISQDELEVAFRVVSAVRAQAELSVLSRFPVRVSRSIRTPHAARVMFLQRTEGTR